MLTHVVRFGSEMDEFLRLVVEAGIILLILFAIFSVYVKNMDNNKKLISQRVTILEKPVQQGNVEWYIMECENGERIKLRTLQANKLLITVGDKGIVSYKGKTIESFHRQ